MHLSKDLAQADPLHELASPIKAVLAAHGGLGEEDLAIVERSIGDLRSHRIGVPIRHAHERLVVAGWIASWVQFVDGRRQIVGLTLPGELIRRAPSCELEVVTGAVSNAMTVSGEDLLEEVHARGGALLDAWRSKEETYHQNQLRQLLRLGRMTAHERIASLILELHERELRAGVANKSSLELPLTQEMIGDVLGLSVMHTNRILQQLRGEGLIDYGPGKVQILNKPMLKEAAMAQSF